MKIRNTVVAAFLAIAASASAAVYIPSNLVTGDGSSDWLIENNDGSLNSGGVFAMGYFTDGYIISTSDMDANILAFTTVASAIVGGPSASLGGSFAGYVEGTAVDTAAIVAPNVLIGRPLYAFVGNLGTLSGSSEWAIKQISTIAEDLPLEVEYFGNPSGPNLPAFGAVDTFTGNASGFGSSTYNTLQLAPIPEPSAALLGALGVLGLLRRRRN